MLKKKKFRLKHFLLRVIVLLSKLSFHSSSFIVFLFPIAFLLTRLPVLLVSNSPATWDVYSVNGWKNADTVSWCGVIKNLSVCTFPVIDQKMVHQGG